MVLRVVHVDEVLEGEFVYENWSPCLEGVVTLL